MNIISFFLNLPKVTDAVNVIQLQISVKNLSITFDEYLKFGEYVF